MAIFSGQPASADSPRVLLLRPEISGTDVCRLDVLPVTLTISLRALKATKTLRPGY